MSKIYEHGRQTREHRDLDIDFDAQFTEALLTLLKKRTDLQSRRIRMEGGLSWKSHGSLVQYLKEE